MEVFYYITIVFFVMSMGLQLLSWLRLLQRNNYKFVRVILSFVNKRSLLFFIFSPLKLLKVFLLGGLFLYVILYSSHTVIAYIIFTLYLTNILLSLLRIYRHGFTLPRFNVRLLILALLTISTSALIFMFRLFDRYYWLLVVDIVSILLLGFYAGIINVINEFYSDYLLIRLSQLLQSNTHCKRILAIGKREDSVFKDYLSMLLAGYAKILSLEKTPIASTDNAKKILRHLKSDTDFLVTFSAHIQDEDIYELDRVIDPHYVIIFPFDFIHLTDKLQRLTRNRILIMNHDIKSTLKINRRKTFFYALHNNLPSAPDIEAIHIRPHKLFTICEIKMKNEKALQVRINILSEINLSYVLPCLNIATLMGLKMSSLIAGIENITPVKGYLYPYITTKKSYIIDGALIVSYDRIIKAIGHGKMFDKKKIVVIDTTLPFSKSEWVEIGYQIGTIYDEVIITEKNNQELLLKGIIRSKGNCKLVENSRKHMAQTLNNLKKDDCLLLLSEDIVLPKNIIMYEAVY